MERSDQFLHVGFVSLVCYLPAAQIDTSYNGAKPSQSPQQFFAMNVEFGLSLAAARWSGSSQNE